MQMFTLRKVIPAGVMFLTIVAGSASVARADVIVFTNQTFFFQATSIVSTATFDQIPAGTVPGIGSANVNGITFAAQNPSAEWVVAAIVIPPSPPNHFQTRNDPGLFETLTFGEGASTNAIGFFLLGGTFPSPAYQIFVTTVDGRILTEDIVINGPSVYRGFVSPEGILSVRIERREFMGGFSNIVYDDVSRGNINEVPEPTTLLLLGTGVAGIVLKVHKRRQSNDRFSV